MDKKQTAVEWLIQSLPQIDWEHPHYGQLLQHAKQMEKQQHQDTYLAAMCRPIDMDKSPIDQAEQYYNENYKQWKQ